MIVYICDYCEEVIPNGSDRYLIRSMNGKTKKGKTVCLCPKCAKTWRETFPIMFAEEKEETSE